LKNDSQEVKGMIEIHDKSVQRITLHRPSPILFRLDVLPFLLMVLVCLYLYQTQPPSSLDYLGDVFMPANITQNATATSALEVAKTIDLARNNNEGENITQNATATSSTSDLDDAKTIDPKTKNNNNSIILFYNQKSDSYISLYFILTRIIP